MQPKHTPGPWKFGFETVKKDWAIVTDSTGGIIANVNTETGPDLYPLVSKKMPAEANARLIAAAPELLQALKNCHAELNQLAFISGDKLSKIALDAALAIIQKVEG